MAKVTGETSWANLEQSIRSVPLLHERNGAAVYPYAEADIALKLVDFESTTASTLYVVKKCLQTQARLAADLSSAGVDLLNLNGGIQITDDDGTVHNMIPPIIEEVPEHDKMVIDGQHRLYNGRKDMVHAFVAIAITNVNPEAAVYAYPNSWDEIVEYDEPPTDPTLKKRYRIEEPYTLYRDFSAVNGSTPREHAR